MSHPHSLLVVRDGTVYALDLAAKLDQTADFICKVHWGEIDFPPPFGREAMAEVRHTVATVLCVDWINSALHYVYMYMCGRYVCVCGGGYVCVGYVCVGVCVEGMCGGYVWGVCVGVCVCGCVCGGYVWGVCVGGMCVGGCVWGVCVCGGMCGGYVWVGYVWGGHVCVCLCLCVCRSLILQIWMRRVVHL